MAMATGRAVTVGVVGLGYWGPNLARNFALLEVCELRWCCDREDARRAAWQFDRRAAVRAYHELFSRVVSQEGAAA